MKRILTLFLVGILLLPSLFACGTEPQATATVPETTPAAPEVPAIEIGESGTLLEGFSLGITEHAWSQENAYFKLAFSFPPQEIAATENYRFRILRQTDHAWELFHDYDKQEHGVVRMTHRFDPNTQTYGAYWGLTDLFHRFESGTYRFSVTCKVTLAADGSTTAAEAWTEFQVLAPAHANAGGERENVSFTEQYFSATEIGPYESPRITVLRSVSKLDVFLEKNETAREYTAHCDEAYFKERMLIVLSLYQDSQGNKCAVDFVNTDETGRLYVGVHCISKSGIPEGENKIVLIEPSFKTERNEDVTLYYNGFKVENAPAQKAVTES